MSSDPTRDEDMSSKPPRSSRSLDSSAAIRVAGPGDAPGLVALLQASDEGDHLRIDPMTMQSWLDTSRTETVFVGEVAGRLVAYAAVQLTESFAYTRPTAELTNLFVLPEQRRSGIASGLFEAAVELCRQRQVLELFIRVNSSNVGAMRFYESQGLLRANHVEYRAKYY